MYNGIVNQLVQSSDGRYWLKLDHTLGAYDIYSKVFTPLKTQPSNLLSTFSSVGDQLYIVDPIKFYLVDRESLRIIPMVFADNHGKINSDMLINLILSKILLNLQVSHPENTFDRPHGLISKSIGICPSNRQDWYS